MWRDRGEAGRWPSTPRASASAPASPCCSPPSRPASAAGAPPSPPTNLPSGAHASAFRAVLRTRAALGYIVGYAVHCWELFAFRSWVVAFLTFNRAFQAVGRGMPVGAPAFVAGVNLLGPPASILGNELAARVG